MDACISYHGLVKAVGVNSLQVCKAHSPQESNFLMSTESNCWQHHAAGDMALAEACL